MKKKAFLSAINTLVNSWTTCEKSALKLMHFACVLRHFVIKVKKNRDKNDVFMRNFHFGKCVQNRGKNRFEINTFCMRFETLCGDKFKKMCK